MQYFGITNYLIMSTIYSFNMIINVSPWKKRLYTFINKVNTQPLLITVPCSLKNLLNKTITKGTRKCLWYTRFSELKEERLLCTKFQISVWSGRHTQTNFIRVNLRNPWPLVLTIIKIHVRRAAGRGYS